MVVVNEGPCGSVYSDLEGDYDLKNADKVLLASLQALHVYRPGALVHRCDPVVVKSGYCSPIDARAQVRLVCMLEGDGCIVFEQNTIEFQPGRWVYVPPSISYRLYQRALRSGTMHCTVATLRV